MRSNLYKDPTYMQRAADHMERYIETMRLTDASNTYS